MIYKLCYKTIEKTRRLLSTFIERCFLPICGVKIGRNLRVGGFIFVENMGEIIIKDNVIINSAKWANPIGAGTKCYFKTFDSGSIRIGNHCGLSNCALVSETEIVLGDNVRVGSGAKLYDTDFHPIQSKYRVGAEKDNSKTISKRIIVEDNAFIGAEAIILKGSVIGKNSVIGAGSVLSAIVPPNEIWAGNPARLIRKIVD